MATINLSPRYIAAFGWLSKETLPKAARVENLSFQQYEEGDQNFEDITFRYDGNEINFGALGVLSKPGLSDIDYSKILAPPPVLNFSKSKKEEQTELNGDEVEVVEVWNTGAWDIKIRGILVDINHHNYPTDLVTKITKLFDYNNVVECSGTQFYEKGIDFLRFQEIEITGVIGFQDTVQFSISARSMKDVGFKLIE